jgi:hypothetical protein
MQGEPDTPGPDGAPNLPDAVPDAVQDLLDGIWSAGEEVAGGIGDVVSELADAINDAVGSGGGGNETEAAVEFAMQTPAVCTDVGVVLV